MHPTPLALAILASGCGVALVPALFGPGFWPLWAAYLALASVLFLCDAARIVSPRRLVLASELPARIFIGTAGTWRVRVTLADGGRASLDVLLLGEIDEEFEPLSSRTVRLRPGQEQTAEFELRPRRRGTLRVAAVWLRWRGPLGLLGITRRQSAERRVPVVPDMGAVRTTALRFFTSPTAQAGLKTERYLGDGSEFDSLRQYVPGLDIRSIDWKASARHRRLLCRRFRAERNHQVVLAIDTGHLMREPLAGVARLDHAINQALLLGYFCLRTGDRVGLFTFAAHPGGLLDARGGLRSFNRLRQHSAEIRYTDDETNFTLAMLALSAKLRRRSLIVVFSEFADTVTAELMLDNLDRLARRHLLVFVSLRDPVLERLEQGALERLGDLHRAVVAANFRLEREEVFARLRRSGIQLVDAHPEQLASDLLNRYFEIKRREML